METGLWRTFRRAWHPDWCQRLETRLFRGLPDVHWTARGRAGWLELKTVKRLRDGAWAWADHRLTIEQALWLDGYTRAGGRCAVLGGDGTRHVLLVSTAYRTLLEPRIPASSVVWEGLVLDDLFKQMVVGE